MTVARSVADVLDEHVVFEVESIDRMYLNVWQPRLAYGGGVQGFFGGHRGYHYASTALMDPMTKAFVADIHGFVAARGLELVSFRQGPAQGRPRPAVSGQVQRRGGVLSSAGPRSAGCARPGSTTTVIPTSWSCSTPTTTCTGATYATTYNSPDAPTRCSPTTPPR